MGALKVTMKTCKCGGNNSLRSSIGGTRCECGGELTLAQVLHRIVSRLDECDEQDSNLIQGLVAAGMDTCDLCGDWFREMEIVRAGDRASCDHCFHWEHFCREEDDEESLDHVLPELFRRIAGTKYMTRLPHEKDGKLSEPFLTYYNRFTKGRRE